MISIGRRPGIIFLIVALFLIVLLNGAWFYGYHDQDLRSKSAPKDSESPQTPSDSATGNAHEPPEWSVAQPEMPPQIDPEEDKVHFDGVTDGGKQHEKEPGQPVTTASIQKPTATPGPGIDALVSDKIDWSRFAYLQYVTATEHVCNSVMVFQSLHRLGSKADRVLLYPQEWGAVDGIKWKALDSEATRILSKARHEYKVELRPVDLIRESGQDPTWEAGFTKLLAFNQTDYVRTIMLDNDATVLKHLDHLFLLPPTPLAMPRAYWLGADPLPEKTIHKYVLSDQLIVATPDSIVFNALIDAIHTKDRNDYDMEIVNFVLGPVALVLPHRALDLLSGEFRREHKPGHKGYDRYLGITEEPWNAKKVLDEAYYVHFSDWPHPKPWYRPYEDKLPELIPKCYPKTPSVTRRNSRRDENKDMDCSDKEAWLWLYSDFKDRRKSICGLDLLDPPSI